MKYLAFGEFIDECHDDYIVARDSMKDVRYCGINNYIWLSVY